MAFHFVTFADGNYHMRSAGKRILQESLESGFFKSCQVANMKTIQELSPEFWSLHKSFINSPLNSSGFGNYIWKAFIVDYFLRDIPKNDSLIYLDAGCHLNFKTQKAINRFENYLSMTSDKESVVTQLVTGTFGIQDLRESSWSSPELIDELQISDPDQKSNQIQAGILFLKNTHINRALTSEWLKYSITDGYRFLMQENWINSEGKHCSSRFDQSIFSCLAKKYSLNTIPDETYFYPNWFEDGRDFPIWAMRRRNGIDVEKFKVRNLPEIILLLCGRISRRLRLRHRS